jgi:hypothetical protein
MMVGLRPYIDLGGGAGGVYTLPEKLKRPPLL